MSIWTPYSLHLPIPSMNIYVHIIFHQDLGGEFGSLYEPPDLTALSPLVSDLCACCMGICINVWVSSYGPGHNIKRCCQCCSHGSYLLFF